MTTDKLSDLLKKSLLEIQALRASLRRAELSRTEPIAIIGLACRAPGGACDPAALWRVFAEGRDVVSPFPERFLPELTYDPDRDASGKTYCREAGSLSGVEEFDAPTHRLVGGGGAARGRRCAVARADRGRATRAVRPEPRPRRGAS